MFKKIMLILTSKWVGNTLAVVKYVFALIGVIVGLSLEIHSNDPVKMGPTPAQAMVTIQQELTNFRMLP